MNDKNYSMEIIRYNISEDQRSNFEKAYTEAGEYLRASEYCLSYQVIHGMMNQIITLLSLTGLRRKSTCRDLEKALNLCPFLIW